ncbi:hypothetical protein KIPB_015415, partial [Kipferlia bialata]|eukprot:g15415.t1
MEKDMCGSSAHLCLLQAVSTPSPAFSSTTSCPGCVSSIVCGISKIVRPPLPSLPMPGRRQKETVHVWQRRDFDAWYQQCTVPAVAQAVRDNRESQSGRQ